MLINIHEYLNHLQWATIGPVDGEIAWTPPMFSSMQIFVFDDAWIDDEFNPFWWEYMMVYRSQHNQPLENNAKRGICDEITARCESHFSEAARKLMGDVDCSAGAKRGRVMLPAGGSVNNVPGPGGHELIVLATTKNQKDVTLYAYEPQNRLRTPLADAIGSGMVIRAVWV